MSLEMLIINPARLTADGYPHQPIASFVTGALFQMFEAVTDRLCGRFG
jgi:hypothetical protein